MGKRIGDITPMKKVQRSRRLEIDDSPPNSAQKKVERDILAVRAVPIGIQILIQSEVHRAVQEAMRELHAGTGKTVTRSAKTSALQTRKTRTVS